MVEKILTVLATFSIAVISGGGYLGIVLLMAIESACIPLPSRDHHAVRRLSRLDRAVRPVSRRDRGGDRLQSRLDRRAMRSASAAGGRWRERWGRYVLIGPGELDAADRFFARSGAIAVLIGRLLPVIRSFIAFPAGVARMRLVPFHLYTFIGSWPWCFGARLGRHEARRQMEQRPADQGRLPPRRSA